MEIYNLDRQIKTDRKGYESIVNLYHTLSAKKGETYKLDFSACTRFDANLSAVLGSVIDLLEEEGVKIWMVAPKFPGVKRTLARNHFLKAFEVETTNEEKESFIKYQRFSYIDDFEFKEYINEELIKKQNFPKHTDLVGQKIVESIYEIYANAIMHGRCGYVYSCGEYDGDSSTPKLNMTIVDCGVTIHKNVCDFFDKSGRSPMDACKAIEWSMEKGNTTKLTTGGLGLSILKDFITLNNGALQIISSNGMYEYKDETVVTSFLCKPFPGTIVNMEFNFSDDKFYLMREEEEKVDMNDLL